MDATLDKLMKAKGQLIIKQPFFAHIIFGMPYIEVKGLQTMATDMKNIFYDPEFVNKISLRELIGVLAHEGLHVAFMHGLRQGKKDHKIWNYANDYAINLIVKQSGLELPLPNLYDEKYKEWSSEKIYDELEKKAIKINLVMPGDGDAKEDGSNVLHGTFMPPKNADGSDLTKEQLEELTEEIKMNVVNAYERAKSAGKLPGGLEGLVKAIGKPKIDWKSYIKTWVKGIVPDNYTWRRANRVMLMNYGIYMPRQELTGAGTGVLSVDTSGSVSDKELIMYVNEIAGLIEMLNPDRLIIIQHDSRVTRIDEWEAGMDFSDLHIKGRGGTNIRPTFRKVEEMDIDPDWMICFTDMGIPDFPTLDEAPNFPVLWCATGPDNAPFGTYLQLKDNMADV